ncbi:polyamine-transporting ATPase 13A3-like [Oppia nitens]|uniref:polyamine-transporting ATPase 13A3-like n=1 Tax=Oppia nitens TaxID=1686743 RepID=UPI0023DAF4B8|nr:polyamine-transporting ATPase 13A3-like [Oppia nitens]
MKVWDGIQSKFPDNNENKNINFNNKLSDNIGDDDEKMEIFYYEKHWLKSILTYILIILTIFILKLLFFWRPHWELYFTHRRCSSNVADSVILIDKYNQIFTEKVVLFNNKNNDSKYVIPESDGNFQSVSSLRYFINKKLRYLWSEKTNKFEKLYGLDRDILCQTIGQHRGLTDEQQFQRALVFGENKIEIKVESYFEILFKEVLTPFYVFQVAAIILWCLDEYYYYGSFILVMSIASLLSSVLQIRRNQKQLRKTVGGEQMVEVWKGGDVYQTQDSNNLVPGDVIVLPSNDFEMICDVVLLNGNAIVDESMLTGESVPVMKTGIPLSPSEFNYKHHFKHIIFSGTKVIQTRYYGNQKVKAVVIRTSFQTAKGELVRSILFPKPVDFKFNRHINQFIIIMICLSLSGFIYTFVIKAKRDESLGDIIIKALDLFTIAVPPELPASMTIASIFVDNRLRANQIYCMSPKSINMSGCVDCVCFDKTGTLTEDELSLAEVLPINLKTKKFTDPITCLEDQQLSPILICVASCHSLTILDSNIIGDPLDIIMFESTKWVLEEPEVSDSSKYDLLAPTIVKPPYVMGVDDSPQVGILRQFPFSSHLSRMSVITRVLCENEYQLYVKGAPEVIATLCDPNTVPKDFDQKLLEYTEKSYRVLALAYKPLQDMDYIEVQRAKRDELEIDLIFLALVVMKNNLKDKTIETIDELKRANIRTLMATGDNLMTALSVAQECHIIDKNDPIIIIDTFTDSDGTPRLECKYKNPVKNSKESLKEVNLQIENRSHLGLTGNTFKIIHDYYSYLIPKLIVCGTVFARMSPENKQQLIEDLQQYGYIVSMVNDINLY